MLIGIPLGATCTYPRIFFDGTTFLSIPPIFFVVNPDTKFSISTSASKVHRLQFETECTAGSGVGDKSPSSLTMLAATIWPVTGAIVSVSMMFWTLNRPLMIPG